MAKTAGKTRKHELLPPWDARGPDGGKVAHTIWIILDLCEEIVPVALATDEFKLKALGVKQVYLLKEIERKFPRHQFRASLELYKIPVVLRQMRRADRLNTARRVLNCMAVVDVERVAGDVAFKPRSGASLAAPIRFEEILGLVSDKQCFH